MAKVGVRHLGRDRVIAIRLELTPSGGGGDGGGLVVVMVVVMVVVVVVVVVGAVPLPPARVAMKLPPAQHT